MLCADASGQLKDEIQSLVEELEKRGLIGRYMSRDCLPGNNRLEWTNQAVFNCNYVIFAISSDLTADQVRKNNIIIFYLLLSTSTCSITQISKCPFFLNGARFIQIIVVGLIESTYTKYLEIDFFK